jgi:hypothetical protein
MRSAETSMQKHLVMAKPNERVTQSAQPSGNQWPEKQNGRSGACEAETYRTFSQTWLNGFDPTPPIDGRSGDPGTGRSAPPDGDGFAPLRRTCHPAWSSNRTSCAATAPATSRNAALLTLGYIGQLTRKADWCRSQLCRLRQSERIHLLQARPFLSPEPATLISPQCTGTGTGTGTNRGSSATGGPGEPALRPEGMKVAGGGLPCESDYDIW